MRIFNLSLRSSLAISLSLSFMGQTPLVLAQVPQPATAPTATSPQSPLKSPLPLLTPKDAAAKDAAATIDATPSSTSSYRLGAGDQIEITVFEYPEVTGPKIISLDGTVTLPVVGSVPAANRTPQQFAQELQTKLKRYLKNPVVTVGITQFRPLMINVAGEVQRPGPIQLRSLTNVNTELRNGDVSLPTLPTVSTALTASGGITKEADIRKVVLKRGNSTSTINLWDALTSENAPPDFFLQDGDTLFVPKLALNETLDRRLIAKSTLAPKTIRVRVVGEVKKPGDVDVTPNSTISGAVATAGGPTDKARLRKVTLVRLADNGEIQKQTLNLENLVDTLQVQDGDVVMVPKSGGSAALDLAGSIFPPLGVIFNLFKRN
jgi:polysaccharide biosynthesis/export protein